MATEGMDTAGTGKIVTEGSICGVADAASDVGSLKRADDILHAGGLGEMTDGEESSPPTQ